MRKYFKRQEGLKLVELMMAMVIASGILFYSVRQYFTYRRDADAYQVRANVDMIFQAMGNYFRANCNKPPFNTEYANVSLGINLTDLRGGGYLTGQLTHSPFIPHDIMNEGYVMQFNQVPLTARQYYLSRGPSLPPQIVNVGNVIIWNAQVSAYLNNPDTNTQYMSILQANCLSERKPSTFPLVVYPCTGDPASSTGNYVVWMRLPSLASSQWNSTYWPTMPIVKQFTQRYTTYPVVIFINNQALYEFQQFFVCGS